MATKHRRGDEVRWTWGTGTAVATVREAFTRRVQRTFDGTKVVRNGSEDDPAYLLEQDDGTRVLKLHSELR